MGSASSVTATDPNHLRGNELFKEGKYVLATNEYTAAIVHNSSNQQSKESENDSADAHSGRPRRTKSGVESNDTTNVHNNSNSNGLDVRLLTNRSFCYLKRKNYSAALQDALQAVTSNPEWYKGYIRVAQVLLAIDGHAYALVYLQEALARLRHVVDTHRTFTSAQAQGAAKAGSTKKIESELSKLLSQCYAKTETSNPKQTLSTHVGHIQWWDIPLSLPGVGSPRRRQMTATTGTASHGSNPGSDWGIRNFTLPLGEHVITQVAIATVFTVFVTERGSTYYIENPSGSAVCTHC